MIDDGLYYEYELAQLRLNYMLTGKKSTDVHSIDEYKSTDLDFNDKLKLKTQSIERDKVRKDVADYNTGRPKGKNYGR